MARVELGRHKKVNNALDDGGSEIQPQHWNNDAHNQVGVQGYDEPSETLISAGVLSPTNTPGHIIVGAQSGTADVLDSLTITDYQINDKVSLFASPGDTITVTHEATGSGQFHLLGGANKTLSETVPLLLQRRGTDWYELGGGSGLSLNETQMWAIALG